MNGRGPRSLETLLQPIAVEKVHEGGGIAYVTHLGKPTTCRAGTHRLRAWAADQYGCENCGDVFVAVQPEPKL